MDFREQIQSYSEQILTKQVLFDLLKEYKRPYDKINELVKQEMLTQLKRGIFIPGPRLTIRRPEPFLIANHLAGPSYVSLETALFHWGFIPEKTFEVSSVTTTRSKIYKTPAGRFSYTHIPLPYYSFGITQIELTKRQKALIATPEKALCDKIVTTAGILVRSSKQLMELLIEDLRIEKQKLRDLNTTFMNKWIKEAPKSSSLAILVNTLEKL